jgi:hypothetical protein
MRHRDALRSERPVRRADITSKPGPVEPSNDFASV